MKPRSLGILLLIFGATAAQAQSPAYFQQKVDNLISVSLDDKANMLRGDLEMTYTNNSPDTLSYLFIHLYPNAYSVDNSAYEKQAVENGSTAHYLASKKDWGFIDSLKFTQDDLPAKIALTTDVDIIRLVLPETILPGATTVIKTPFRVKIPKTFSRLGHAGNTYQISQWFPKPAVYDRDGWHPMPYLDQGEFYSEYGSYDVSITLPKNYVILATGDLQTASEQAWLEKKTANYEEEVKNASQTPIASSIEMKTVRFTEDKVHDFAWFADKSWVVQMDTVKVPNSENIATVYSAYNPKLEKYWRTSVAATKQAVRTYSRLVGAYPYKTVKVVAGALTAGGGMEYPTITVIAPNMGAMNDEVIVHEVGHNWFYGILGSNERRDPWLDEGINSYYENIAVSELKNQSRAVAFLNGLQERAFGISMAVHRDMAMGLPAAEYTSGAYGLDVYGKSPAYLNWLAEYMGQANFDAAMKEYFNTWKFKHPKVQDFEKIFRSHTDKNLDWFFTDGLYSNKSVDFKIKSVKHSAEGTTVKVKNKTGFLAPVALVTDSSDAAVWMPPFTGTSNLLIKDDFKKVAISSVIPDYNMSNNSSNNRLKVKPFGTIQQSYDRRIFVAPSLGYNVYDRFMLGLAFHNLQMPEKSFQYMITPMYGFKSNTIVGGGFLSQAFYPSSTIFQEIDLNLLAKRYSFSRTQLDNFDNPRQQFLKIAPELKFTFKKPFARSSVNQSLSVKGYYIEEGYFDFILNPVDSQYLPSKGGVNSKKYAKLNYQYENNRTFNPYSFEVEGQLGETFSKLSLEAKLKIDYFYKNRGINLRVFAGKMWDRSASSNSFVNSRYGFASTYSGRNDYLYDETFVGRNMQTSLASQQIYIKDGGLKIPTLLYANPVGTTQDWMAAINLSVDLPMKYPIQFFADFLSIADAKTVNSNGSKWLYDAGISFNLFKAVDVYVPILMSSEYKDYKTSVLGKNAFWKTVTFHVALDKIYWPRLQREVKIF